MRVALNTCAINPVRPYGVVEMSHPIQCQCGCLKGELLNPKLTHRVKCYCRDCQAFAHFLGKSNDILDEQGGTDIVQTQPKNLIFSQGYEHLACMKLSKTGLIRWYASCCNTPIGNTLPNHKLPFIGLVHNCLEVGDRPLDEVFGKITCYVNTESARQEPKPKTRGLLLTIAKNLTAVLRARLNGDYRQNLFFERDSGAPIATPKVLTTQENEAVLEQS